MKTLRSRVALIIGGARMGLAVSEFLAKQGMDVVVSYRHSRKEAKKMASVVSSFGRKSFIMKTNVTKENEVKDLMSVIHSEMGRLDVLINMSSTYEHLPWKNLNAKTWSEQLDNNLKGAFLSVLYGAPLLKKSHGRVIHFADWVSASGRPRYRGFVPYYAAKAGIVGLTQVQALELAPTILVNAIAPGPILPPVGSSKKEISGVISETPLKRWGGVEEIIKAVHFLIDTSFVTGECIRVDGGRHLY